MHMKKKGSKRTKSAGKRIKLNGRERAQLYDWFKQNLEEIDAKRLSQNETAAWASKEMPFHVSSNTLAGIASERKGSMMHYVWSRRKNGNATKDEVVDFLTTVVEQLLLEANGGYNLNGKYGPMLKRLGELRGAPESDA